MSKIYPSSPIIKNSLSHTGINQTLKQLNETETENKCDDEIRDELKQLWYNDNKDIKKSSKNPIVTAHDDDGTSIPEGKWPSPLDDKSAMKRKTLTFLASNFEEIRNQLKITGTIIVRFVTWNQQGQSIPHTRDMTKHLFPHYFYHIIAVGTQECENSISKSLFYPSKRNWEKKCEESVGGDYELASGHALGGTHL